MSGNLGTQNKCETHTGRRARGIAGFQTRRGGAGTRAMWARRKATRRRGAGANSATLNDNDMATGLRHGREDGREERARVEEEEEAAERRRREREGNEKVRRCELAGGVEK